ncbi:AzlD domain-containing protein [Psychrobium sp. 1_MG-2023]|uniref:AzlD domain-containing protein n=1 Tax=Psychrobium sp. 1_MG-2023 TaxID=3062624 RepID=UPI000C32EB91|nr:AzlD domain-containing protein [Psychrobium sp. 1_MG-2023]MDP2560797.1 AzlD domain-containing protein [Psychrobium sp. 1_MG-2023]PKF56674.1 branched-chain amino acid ABC transporter [Alteromonadales bacterium alter-6D02]
MNIWLLIALMALVTFSIRYALYARANAISLPPKLERALKFSAPCVLTAIWVPAVLMPQGELALSLDNPYLIGGAVAVVIGLWKKNILLTIVLSMLTFFSYKALML